MVGISSVISAQITANMKKTCTTLKPQTLNAMDQKITQLKEDIAILQEKLHKLEELEKLNAIPRMNLENEGKFDIVSYNNEIYYRLEYPTGIIWYKRSSMLAGMALKLITDPETHRLLEGVWYNDVEVKREKERIQSTNWEPKPQSPEEVEEGLRAAMRQAKEEGVFDDVENQTDYKPSMFNCILDGNPPNGYSYWNEWYNELGSKGILHNLKISSIDNVNLEPEGLDEPLEYDEIEHDISENVENKTIKDVINRWWLDTFSPKNMWPIGESIDDLSDQIEFWILRNKK